PGRQRTVQIANRVAGRRVLEVGVGTGLSLASYRRDLSVTGIDISDEMLRQARRRVAAKQLRHVEALYNMDAENLAFADDSFDTVIAMYVASVVPHPDRLLAEVQRVCKPDGQILIVNHFAETRGLRGRLVRSLSRWSTKLGWRPDFTLEPFLRHGRLDVLETERAAPFGLFTILLCRNAKRDGSRHPDKTASGRQHAFRH
ncbi:MAG TPA: class I SAM-dependent methyltransferase, partial [Candidatus Sulfotelmatobacter sp.]|nr:class I SAM-dependent methyltransferase [Candidatus Sulfotelmatobacter sp.]